MTVNPMSSLILPIDAEAISSTLHQELMSHVQHSIRMFNDAVKYENMDGRWENWKSSFELQLRVLVSAGVSSQEPVRRELEEILDALQMPNL